MKMKKTDLKPMCTEQSHDDGDQREDVKPGRSVLHEDSIELDDAESYMNSECIAADSPSSTADFNPIYSIGYWDDPEDNDNPCASVAILTFTGIDKLSDFSLNIVGNKTLEYKVLWPEAITNNTLLHRVWIEGKGKRKKIEEYHGMVKCMDGMLAPMRRHDTRVETTARIPIDMKVESRPEIHLLAFPGSTARIIYVILRGPARKVANLDDQSIELEQ